VLLVTGEAVAMRHRTSRRDERGLALVAPSADLGVDTRITVDRVAA